MNGKINNMRYLKTYKLFEFSHEEIMDSHYGVDTMKECDSMIEEIKDMLLELKDIGLFTMCGYTPMTLSYKEWTPKIIVEVQGFSSLCSSVEEDINSTFERIKDYVKSKGYVTGFGTWERDYDGGRKISVYQVLIQK